MSKLSLSKMAYGFVFCAAMAIGSPAQTSTTLMTLHSFNKSDGANPEAVLVQGVDGKLYGTTYSGGANNDGTAFKITTAGVLGTPLHSFNISDGQNPEGGLVQAPDGNFYGTTVFGGAHPSYGTVFKMTPAGAVTFPPLHSFNQTDGEAPEAGLVLANGILYGTTYDGGSDPLGGTVFKITTAGVLTTPPWHSFTTDTGGYEPAAGLVQGTDGNFYGTTYHGGTSYGTVFKITPTGVLKPLHSFNKTDGANPASVLIQGADGNFYGTTVKGGAHGMNGTIFKMTPAGVLTTSPWHSFAYSDGSEPMAGLVQATDGNFYGTTYAGYGNGATAHHFGTIFKITPAGVLTTLYSLPVSGTDGYYPKAGLVQDTDGNFYGTTSAGGTSNACNGGCGTVFRLSVGLGPFLETEPTSGRVGTGVIILGNNLTGASSVTFNGTAATFTVVSASEIRTTVPTGATTGKVKVTISSRTLLSNVNFRVN